MTSPPGILASLTNATSNEVSLTPDDLRQLREYFNGSLFAFAWTFFGFRDLIPAAAHPLGGVHGQICDLLRQHADGEIQRLMIQIPRGSYKTSLCTMAYALWSVCRQPEDMTVLICNERLDNAKKWLRAIKEIVAGNALFRLVYADLIPPGVGRNAKEPMERGWKWSDEEVNLAGKRDGIPECHLTAAGVGTATAGGHWKRIIKDDLVSEDAKNSEAVMEKACSWYDSSLPLEEPPYDGSELVVCTPWTYGDVYRHALEKYNLNLYRRSVLEEGDDGKLYSLLPHRWTVEALLKEQERDPYYFSSQMMCMPRAGKENSFNPDWLRWGTIDNNDSLSESGFTIRTENYDRTACEVTETEIQPTSRVPLWWMQRCILMDPAAAESNAKARAHARTAIVVAGIDAWGRKYVLDCWAGREEPTVIIDRVLHLASRWQVNRIGVEEVTFSTLYSHWLRERARQRNQHITVYGLKPGGRTKEFRIEALIPPWRAGLIYLNDLPQVKLLEREFLDYPYGATRDILDALSYWPEVLRRPSAPDTHFTTDDPIADLESGRCDVTGY